MGTLGTLYYCQYINDNTTGAGDAVVDSTEILQNLLTSFTFFSYNYSINKGTRTPSLTKELLCFMITTTKKATSVQRN